MLKKYCERCFSIQEYNYYIDLENEKTLNIYLYVLFTEIDKNISFDLVKYYFKSSLWDGVHKGKQINTSLFITEDESEELDINNEIIKKTKYELKFFIESLNDLKYIDTSILESICLPPKLSYVVGGIQYMKINTIGKAINLFKDPCFNHTIKHFFDFRFAQSVPVSIKTLYDKTEIIKQANHGNNNCIINSSFNNLTDYCKDIYSSLIVAQRPTIGTNYFDFRINPNLFDKLKYIGEKNMVYDNNDMIISIL